MKQFETKHMSLIQAVEAVPDNALLALGGGATTRQPMALVREIVRQQKRGLRLCGYRRGMDFDLLARADCAASVDLPDSDDFIPSAFARFEAAAAGLPFALVKLQPGERTRDDVFVLKGIDGEGPVHAVHRLVPDIALIHAHAADIYGNVQMDLEAHADFSRDIILARAAKRVIVSVEQIVSPQAIANAPRNTVLSSDEVFGVVEAPYGAFPLECENRYSRDENALNAYTDAARTPSAFKDWLAQNIYAFNGHKDYLDRLGMRRLQEAKAGQSILA